MTAPEPMPTGWRSLWRAFLALPREMLSPELTVFVRAVTRDEAHRAMERMIQTMFPTAELELMRTAYYNLTSARELLEAGVSERECDRLFETGWQGQRVVAWVENPVFVVPDAGALFAAWTMARQPALPVRGAGLGREHAEALRELRIGVQLDSQYLPDAPEKLAALDAAIAAAEKAM